MTAKRVVLIVAAVMALLAVCGLGVWLWQAEQNPSKQLQSELGLPQPQEREETTSTESPYIRGELREPPVDAAFSSYMVQGQEGLRTALPENLAQLAWLIFQRHKCESSQFLVYEKKTSPAKLIVSECHRVIEPATANQEAILEIEYPVMVTATKTVVYELRNLNEFGFMYDSGLLKAVTDLNNNGHLELWLEGAICECDGEQDENEPCECTGTSVVEAFGDRLRAYKP